MPRRLNVFLQTSPPWQIAILAHRALVAEAKTTPKPGLVDCDNNGAHRDMSLPLFLKSAETLKPYFLRCALAGWFGEWPGPLFARLRTYGRKAELDMLAATKGINTHKGAIFSLGLLAAAAASAARLGGGLEQVEIQVKRLSRGLVENDFAALAEGQAATAGERSFQAFRVTGARGQAEAGFPQIFRGALPRFDRLMAQGRNFNQAAMETLIWLIAEVEDTNLLARGGWEGLTFAAGRALALIEEDRAADPASIRALDREFIARNLSPGGCADLLAGACFLFFLKQRGLLRASGLVVSSNLKLNVKIRNKTRP